MWRKLFLYKEHLPRVQILIQSLHFLGWFLSKFFSWFAGLLFIPTLSRLLKALFSLSFLLSLSLSKPTLSLSTLLCPSAHWNPLVKKNVQIFFTQFWVEQRPTRYQGIHNMKTIYTLFLNTNLKKSSPRRIYNGYRHFLAWVLPQLWRFCHFVTHYNQCEETDDWENGKENEADELPPWQVWVVNVWPWNCCYWTCKDRLLFEVFGIVTENEPLLGDERAHR